MTSIAYIPPFSFDRASRQRKTVILPSKARFDQPVKVSSSVAIWLRSLNENIVAITSLKRGWDGPKSQAVSLEKVAKLLRVLLLDIGAHNAHPPQLVPLASGGVQAEWHYRQQSIEVGISADDRIFAFATDVDGNVVVELEDTWLVPSNERLALRRSLYSLAERSKDSSG
jgi:hypothetical protein